MDLKDCINTENMVTIDKIMEVLDNSDFLSNTKKAILIFKETLPEQQRNIFELIGINEENATTCKEISEHTGIETKNISAQIKQIQQKCSWISSFDKSSGKAYYFNREIPRDNIEGFLESFLFKVPEYNGKNCNECNCVEIAEAINGGPVKKVQCRKTIEPDNILKSV